MRKNIADDDLEPPMRRYDLWLKMSNKKNKKHLRHKNTYNPQKNTTKPKDCSSNNGEGAMEGTKMPFHQHFSRLGGPYCLLMLTRLAVIGHLNI
jgi:hypothetical protein